MSREDSHLLGRSPATNAGDDASATVELRSDYIGLALTGETEAIMVRLPHHALVVHESAPFCRSVKPGQFIRDYAGVMAGRTNLGNEFVRGMGIPIAERSPQFHHTNTDRLPCISAIRTACRQLLSPNILTTPSILTRNRFSKTDVTSSAETAVGAASRIGAIAR